MTGLVLGATGATGKLYTSQLLGLGWNVKVIVRSRQRLPKELMDHPNIEIIEGSVLEMEPNILAKHLENCDVVASCLGHNIHFKGIYGKPRKLVRDSIIKVSEANALNNTSKVIKIILMNTAGNRNRDLKEPISFGERIVIGLLRLLLPPHPDNEQAAEFLRLKIGHNDASFEWVVVRPDDLIDDDNVSGYEIVPSPTSSPIFNPGKTSRINVANFMAKLSVEESLWQKWRGQMPVIYNTMN